MGKPPVLKGGELEKRLLRREEAQKQKLPLVTKGPLKKC